MEKGEERWWEVLRGCWKERDELRVEPMDLCKDNANYIEELSSCISCIHKHAHTRTSIRPKDKEATLRKKNRPQKLPHQREAVAKRKRGKDRGSSVLKSIGEISRRERRRVSSLVPRYCAPRQTKNPYFSLSPSLLPFLLA